MTRIEDTRLMGYRLEMYPDEDGSWAAEIPELLGCVGAGTTPDEAVANLEDALEAWIEAARADGRPIPPPARIEEEYSGRFLLRVAKTLHRQLAERARREGVSLNQYCGMVLAGSAGYSHAPAPMRTVQAFIDVGEATEYKLFFSHARDVSLVDAWSHRHQLVSDSMAVPTYLMVGPKT